MSNDFMNNGMKHRGRYILSFLFFFSVAVISCLYIYSMSNDKDFLNREIQKLDTQNLSFLKQSYDMLRLKTEIDESIDSFYSLQKHIKDDNAEEIKKALLKNPKSSDLLSILPHIEIAYIQQDIDKKNISERIENLKFKATTFLYSINRISGDKFSKNHFSVGNLKDYPLSKPMSKDIAILLEQESAIFNTFFVYDNSFEKFKKSTESLQTAYPLLQKTHARNKLLLAGKINSLDANIQYLKILSIASIFMLISSLIFLILKPNGKPKSLNMFHEEIENFETTVQNLAKKKLLAELSIDEKVQSLIGNINKRLEKRIKVHLKLDSFGSLTLEQKDRLTGIILALIKFSGVYSFDTNKNGYITVSLNESDGRQLLTFKDSGKGLYVQEIKDKIKKQYGVNDSVFIGKTNEQIFSFIFKPGFQLVSNPEGLEIKKIQLDVVSELIKELNARIQLSTQENHGTQFRIKFQSI